MIKMIIDENRQQAIDYLNQNPVKCVYQKGFVETKLFDNPNIVNMMCINEGKICGIISGYNDFYYIHLEDRCGAEEVANLINMNTHVDQIVIDKNKVNELDKYLYGDYIYETATFSMLKSFNKELLFDNLKVEKLDVTYNNVELEYELLLKCDTAVGKLDDFYLSCYEKNKAGVFAMYGIFCENKLVACANIGTKTKDTALITCVATDPDYRRCGYSSAIMSNICKTLLESNIIPCLAYSNPVAGKMYEKFGFEKVYELAMLVKNK